VNLEGRLAVVVCDLCGAFVLWQGRDQHERWHRSVVATPPSGDDPTGPIMLIAADRRTVVGRVLEASCDGSDGLR
jgi:hypothetical protein